MKNSIDLLKEGLQNYQAGNLRKAEKSCRQVLAIDPKNTVSLNMLSIILSQSGKTQKAIEFLEKY